MYVKIPVAKRVGLIYYPDLKDIETRDLQVGNLENQIKEYQQQIMQLNKQYNTISKESKDIERDNVIKENKLLLKQIENLKEKNIKHEKQQEELNKNQTILVQLEFELEKCKNQFNSQIVLINELSEYKNNISNELEFIKKQLQLSTREKENVARYNECNKNLQNVNKSMQECTKNLNDLQTEHLKLKEKKDTVNVEIPKLEESVKSAQSEIIKLTNQVNEGIKENNEKIEKLKQQENTISSLKESLELKQKEYTILQLKYQQCKENSQQSLLPNKESDTEQKLQQEKNKLKFIESQQEIYKLLLNNQKSKLLQDIITDNNFLVDKFIKRFGQLYETKYQNDQDLTLAYNLMYQQKQVLMNLYEDNLSAVRVYIRLKSNSDYISTSNAVVTSSCSIETQYGPFFGILPPGYTNKDVYTGCIGTEIDKSLKITSHQTLDFQDQKCCILSDTAGLCRVVEQLTSKYQVLLFSYGPSGSGKTYSLFGTNDDPGLVQLSIANSGATSVQIDEIFELQVGNIDFRSGMRFSNRSEINIFDTSSKSAVTPINSSSLNQFMLFLQDINNVRVKNKNILATPNNPRSSRSHLFIKLKLFFQNGHSSKFTICDLGGLEKPYELMKMFYKVPDGKDPQFISILMGLDVPYKRHVFTIDDPLIAWYNGDDKSEYVNNLNKVDVKLLLQQSIFINETLNQFEYFIKSKQGDSITYNMIKEDSKYFSNIGITENTYNPRLFLTKRPKFDQNFKNSNKLTQHALDPMKMYSVLTSFDDPQVINKYVMLCHVRPERVYCQETNSTLDFANKIKST